MTPYEKLELLKKYLADRIEYFADKESKAIESRHWARVMNIILFVNRNFI